MRISEPLSELAYAVFRFWRKHELGRKLLRKIAPKFAARREIKRALRKAEREAAGGEFFTDEEGNDMNMDAIKGGLKSKLVWLGIVQLAYSIFKLWANDGLNAESASTAISGALTIVLRAVTTTSLAEKA